MSCTVGVSGSAHCGALLWCCAFTFGPCPSIADRPGAGAEADSGVDADGSVGVWTEPLLPEVEGCEISNVLTTPRLAFVGRVLDG